MPLTKSDLIKSLYNQCGLPKNQFTNLVESLMDDVPDRVLEEIMTERGLSVDHSTIFRWVQRYSPELDRRCRPHLKQTNDSWRVDETFVKVRGKWMYLYRAVDSTGQTIDFLLNETRSTRARSGYLAHPPLFQRGNTR